MKELFSQVDQCYQQGDLAGAEKLLTDALHALDTAGEESLPDCVQLTNDLAGLYRGVSRYPESLRCYYAALAGLERLGQAHSLPYATVAMNCAGTYRLMGRLEDAQALFLQTKALLEDLALTEDYVYFSVLNNLALAYQFTSAWEQAEDMVRLSLQKVRALPDAQHEIATALNNLAAIRLRRDDLEEASQLISQALELYQHMPPPNIHHAAALATRGDIRYRCREVTAALADFQEAREKTLAFSGQNLDYAIACENIAAVCIKLNRRTEALEAQRQAAALLEKLLGPNHPRTAGAQRTRWTVGWSCRMRKHHEGSGTKPEVLRGNRRAGAAAPVSGLFRPDCRRVGGQRIGVLRLRRRAVTGS